MKKIYKGWLSKNKWKDTIRLITNKEELELLEEIQDDICSYGNHLSVRYYISSKETTLEQVKEDWLKKVMGITDCEYFDRHGSEWTGYMWTDQELNVGGHNLRDELESYFGKYLILEIDYHMKDKD